MTWYHPKYYAALRAEKRKLQASSFKPQATSGKRQEPDRPAQPEIVLNKKSIDRDPDIGYRGIAPELSRVCRVAGRSSARAVPRPERDSDRSSSSKKTNSPLKVSAMSAVSKAGTFRAVSPRIHAVTIKDSTVGPCTCPAASSKPQAPSDSSSKQQASSPKQQASSSKPQASSSMIREPRNI